ncbi:hypothetical protein HDU76_000369 [Blyttiomyces sp. JEL0837]|nr:hypothetical protein HDU76_000369 [Blyttiomyces sp. JEL0837]
MSRSGFHQDSNHEFADDVHSSLISGQSTVNCELRKAFSSLRGPGTGFLVKGSGSIPQPGESNKNSTNTGGTTDDDSVGLFPALHPRCAGTEFQYIAGLDIFARDPMGFPNVSSVCDCARLCDMNSLVCYFFVYKVDSGNCWLKKTVEPAPSYTWFPESTDVIPGDLSGHDLGVGVPLKVGDQCNQLCAENPDCTWTNFVYEGQPDFVCHLKAAQKNSQAVLGFRVQYSSKALTSDTVVISGIDIPGFDLSQLNFTTHANCSSDCKKNQDCDFFATGNSCILKSTNKSDASMFTWFKRSTSPIKGHLPHGPNDKSFDLSPPTTQPSPFACFNLCQSNQNCLWVNYNYLDNSTSTSVSCIQRNGVMGRGMNIGYQIIPIHNVVWNWNDTIITKNISTSSKSVPTSTSSMISSSSTLTTTGSSITVNFPTTISASFPSTGTGDTTTEPRIVTTATGTGTIMNTSKSSTMSGSVTSQPPSPTVSQQQEDSSTAKVNFTPAVIAVSIIVSSLIIFVSFVVGVWVGERNIRKKGAGGGQNEGLAAKDTPKFVDVVNTEHDDENSISIREIEAEIPVSVTEPRSNELNPDIQRGLLLQQSENSPISTFQIESASDQVAMTNSTNIQVPHSMYSRGNRGDSRGMTGGGGFAMGIGVDGDAVDVSLESELQLRNGVYSVWSHERVMGWVNLKKLDQDGVDIFKKNNFDGSTLATLDVRLLTEKYHVQDSYLRSKIMQAVKSLRLGSRAVVGSRGIGELEPPAYGET